MSELVATDFEDGVLHVTLLRPEKRNALSNALIAAIGATFTTWSERDDVSVAVLTGAGDKAFASGGDLKELESLREEADAVAFAARTRAALDTIRRFPVPVVAVLNGDAFGGGAELAHGLRPARWRWRMRGSVFCRRNSISRPHGAAGTDF